MSSSLTIRHGWVDEPNGRGTWTIFSTCVLTIILCCWTSTFPNIPSKADSAFKQWRYKFDLACIGLLGPEFLLMLALGQWSSARTSVKKFHALGYPKWTLTHSFFADMGGFLIEDPGMEMSAFPVDAEQLRVLVHGGYLDYPDIDEEDIKDRSKSDGLTRFITVAQGLWFSINCILRFAQHLFVTTLELTTLSFIIIFLVTSFCWDSKPMDVGRPITLQSKAPITVVRAKYHPSPKTRWHETPLDFLSRHEWFCARFWRYYTQILHYMHIPLFTRPNIRPYDRIPSDNFPGVDTRAEVICTPVILLFSCMFLFAWNFYFPSESERILWRIASVYMLVYGVGGGLFSAYCHKTVFNKEIGKGIPIHDLEDNRPAGWISRIAEKLENIDPERDPELEIPIRILIPISILCAFYCVCRAVVLVEDIIGLRSLPESAFQTVSWSKYIPHW